jgi:hypothetical protein
MNKKVYLIIMIVAVLFSFTAISRSEKSGQTDLNTRKSIPIKKSIQGLAMEDPDQWK